MEEFTSVMTILPAFIKGISVNYIYKGSLEITETFSPIFLEKCLLP